MASNDLTKIHGSAPIQPDYFLHKHLLAADSGFSGGVLAKVAAEGCDFKGRIVGFIQAIPRNGTTLASGLGGSQTLTVKVLEWCPGLGKFIASEIADLTAGADTPVRGSFNAYGRILFFYVTGVAGGKSASIYVSSDDVNNLI